VYLYSEYLFGIVFGKEWGEAGAIASILAPMFYLQFVASPLSYSLYLSGKNIEDLIWQVISAMVLLAILVLSAKPIVAIQMIAAGYSCLYILNLYMSFSASKGTK
jgi:O-antigen/teichoic acid export membrane protein